ncbi:uncharacterized protein FYW47_014545 [Aplochiton taeniatus]
MSSGGETCPFCGKPFKRLKTHLPHCKMSPVSQGTVNPKTPPLRQDAMTNMKKQKISGSSPASTPLTSAVPETATNRRGKSSQTFSSTTTPESKQMRRASPLPSSPPPPSSSSLTTSKSSLTTTKSALTERSLGQITLRELPDWLALKTPGSPREGLEILQRGWQWYYRRYIDVRRTGVGGVAMLLAGYCVLSYIWSYPHIKRDRWRRYH